jgi:hypothetical protein
MLYTEASSISCFRLYAGAQRTRNSDAAGNAFVIGAGRFALPHSLKSVL